MKHSELRHQPRHVNPRIQVAKIITVASNTAKVFFDISESIINPSHLNIPEYDTPG